MPQGLKIISFIVFTATMCPADEYEPETPETADFAALVTQSPFNRPLNVSGSLVLTGIAQIDNQQVVTLLDTQANQTYVVSSTPNELGWRMVEISLHEDLERVTARISVSGEIVNIRYTEVKLKPGRTHPGGGKPRMEESEQQKSVSDRPRPPDEIRRKIDELRPEQREKFIEKMRELKDKRPEMSPEDRSNYAKKTLEKMAKKTK